MFTALILAAAADRPRQIDREKRRGTRRFGVVPGPGVRAEAYLGGGRRRRGGRGGKGELGLAGEAFQVSRGPKLGRQRYWDWERDELRPAE
jgi:hypothetical protein